MTYALRIAALPAALAAAALVLLVATHGGGPSPVRAGLPAILTVNTAADHTGHQFDDFLSLREAILLATGDLDIVELSAGECAQIEPAAFPDACETPYLLGAPYPNTINFDPAVFPQLDPPSISSVATYQLDTFGNVVDATGAFVTIQGAASLPCFSISGDANEVQNLTLMGCRDAVEIVDGSQNLVASNTLVSSARHGVAIAEQSSANSVEDNSIGVDSLGHNAGNGLSGVLIDKSSGNTVSGNLIANNGSAAPASTGPSDNAGVTVTAGTGNNIEANEFHDNAGLAIDLAGDGVTENDAGDPDSGPNNRQNFPVVSEAVAQSPFRVTGILDGVAGLHHRLDMFENETCDPSGNGEGARYLGSAEIVTHGGPSDFLEFLNPAVTPGKFVTSTATNLLTGDTSEFSDCVVITAAAATPTPVPTPTPVLTPTPTPVPTFAHGDIDCDGDVDSIDVLKLLAHLVGDPFPQPSGCPPLSAIGDVDCDGDVDAVDALQILRFLAGLPVNQEQGCTQIGQPL